MRGAEITALPLDPAALLERVGGPDDGAVVLFAGTVRRSNEGHPVTSLRYDAYEAMARQVLAAIVDEAAERWQLGHVVAVHRVGELEPGEVSVLTAVSAPHREQAYEASRYLIEEIKRRLPVWKQEHYADSGSRWLAGVEPAREG
jgi:molybdopterin synthase catalytic subunit